MSIAHNYKDRSNATFYAMGYLQINIDFKIPP